MEERGAGKRRPGSKQFWRCNDDDDDNFGDVMVMILMMLILMDLME